MYLSASAKLALVSCIGGLLGLLKYCAKTNTNSNPNPKAKALRIVQYLLNPSRPPKDETMAAKLGKWWRSGTI